MRAAARSFSGATFMDLPSVAGKSGAPRGQDHFGDDEGRDHEDDSQRREAVEDAEEGDERDRSAAHRAAPQAPRDRRVTFRSALRAPGAGGAEEPGAALPYFDGRATHHHGL